MANHEGGPGVGDSDAARAARSEQGQDPQITLRGIIVREPEFDQVRQGQLLRGKFSLAHHPNPDNPKETVFYEVVAFAQAAETLREWFQTGHLQPRQLVEVSGTPHDYEYTGRDGQPRIKHEIALSRVVPVQPDRRSSPQTPQPGS